MINPDVIEPSVVFTREVMTCLIRHGFHVETLNEGLQCIYALCASNNRVGIKEAAKELNGAPPTRTN